MKRSIWLVAIVTGIVALSSAFFFPVDKREMVLTDFVSQFLNIRHYQPLEINDEFSSRVFDMYLERMDLNKRYFLQSDVDKMAESRYKIDNQWNSRSSDFFDQSSELLQKRLLETKAMFTEYLSKPFDLTTRESLETDPKKSTFPKNQKELKEAWRKALKLQVVMRVAGNLQSQEEAAKKSDTVKVKSIEVLEAEARKGLMENYNDWYTRIKTMDRGDRWSIYVNSIISVYDPHSQYMPPRDQERFNINMAGKYEGIGATLRQRDGYLMVVDMFPGSPSWRSKQMEINDLIMRVAQSNNEFVDILDMKMDDAVAMIKGPKGTKVRLTLRKRDGSVKEISLVRDVIIMEESYAGSLILKQDQSKAKIGYIYLPQFYLDFQDKNGRKCSEDVAKEIAKLKAEGIDGIILDIRNNGGGSLPEAVDLAGLFIEKGPVVQVKAREGSPEILSDRDSKIHYDGPLVVMTNYSSASASEIFAGAIQDYQRGVIVGSPSTWGKGTVQRVADLDAYLPTSMNDVKPLGAISLTIQKYYRINGETTQLNGVIPDIVLPDSYQKMDIGEKENEYALAWDRIPAADFKPWNRSVNTAQLSKQSARRVSASNDFDLINENAARLKEESDKTLFTLNLDEYRKELKTKSEEVKKFEKLMKSPTSVKPSVLKADHDLFVRDTAKKEISDRLIDDLRKDIYLEEAVRVMADIIGK